MSEEKKDVTLGDTPMNPQTPDLTITINYYEKTDHVDITGPLNARGKSYMMLEMARELVYDWHARQAFAPLEPVS